MNRECVLQLIERCQTSEAWKHLHTEDGKTHTLTTAQVAMIVFAAQVDKCPGRLPHFGRWHSDAGLLALACGTFVLLVIGARTFQVISAQVFERICSWNIAGFRAVLRSQRRIAPTMFSLSARRDRTFARSREGSWRDSGARPVESGRLPRSSGTQLSKTIAKDLTHLVAQESPPIKDVMGGGRLKPEH